MSDILFYKIAIHPTIMPFLGCAFILKEKEIPFPLEFIIRMKKDEEIELFMKLNKSIPFYLFIILSILFFKLILFSSPPSFLFPQC